ncbi:MAG: hypothetical protein WC953_12150 [Pseudomonas sp.]
MTLPRLILFTLLCLSCFNASAATLTIIKPRETQLTRAFVEALQHHQPDVSLQVQLLGNNPDPRPASVMVTMGLEALQWRLQQDINTPTIATYITLDQLDPDTQYPNFVQILLASPKPERQLILASLLLPRLKTVGMLYSPQQRWQTELWQRAARQQTLALSAQVVDHQSELLRSLSIVLNSSDVLIGIDDPQIYNADTLKPLLLTSYNRKRVLIGPSAPFIAAGSLSTTYSSPLQMAHSTYLLMEQKWQDGAIRYPEHFSVLSNSQVARSLGLPPPSDATLQRLIQHREQASP